MTEAVTIIGSGPSGVHAALTLLERGKAVTLYDIGETENPFPSPSSDFHELKTKLDDPFTYFWGEDYRALIPPGHPEVFDYPPSRNFRIRPDDSLTPYSENGFKPVISHNRGGLGVAWGANCIPFDDDDLRDFPIRASDLRDDYQTVSRRIPIAGPQQGDSLSPHLQPEMCNTPPLELNRHDSLLLQNYGCALPSLAKKGFGLGLARLAVDNNEHSSHGCVYCQRCLWGCPRGAIYNPNTTLDLCRRYPQFIYVEKMAVTHLSVHDNRIVGLKVRHAVTRQEQDIPCNTVVLAAGAIGSAAIFLRTLARDLSLAGKILPAELKTRALLDTRVIKLPYILLRMIGRQNPQKDFQFNKLILGYFNDRVTAYPRYIHGEILSLTSFLYHSLIESLPFGSRFSTAIFSKIRQALGAVTYFLPDKPEPGNHLALKLDPASLTGDRVEFFYRESTEKIRLEESLLQSTKKALRKLGCHADTSRVIRPPSGSGIHYGGTIPMNRKNDVLCVDPSGKSYAYENLYVADGASFPTLPSKSITYTLMANASRVARYMQ